VIYVHVNTHSNLVSDNCEHKSAGCSMYKSERRAAGCKIHVNIATVEQLGVWYM
jgi:hypothetical protein